MHSTRPGRVVVHYPFHPLRGEELEVDHRMRRGEALATVFVGGTKLQIPTWMLEPWSAASEIELRPMVAVPALVLVADLLGQLDGGCRESGAGKAPGSSTVPRGKNRAR